MNSDEQQPWWNDMDKVSGLAATCVILAGAILVLSGAVWVAKALVF